MKKVQNSFFHLFCLGAFKELFIAVASKPICELLYAPRRGSRQPQRHPCLAVVSCSPWQLCHRESEEEQEVKKINKVKLLISFCPTSKNRTNRFGFGFVSSHGECCVLVSVVEMAKMAPRSSFFPFLCDNSTLWRKT